VSIHVLGGLSTANARRSPSPPTHSAACQGEATLSRTAPQHGAKLQSGVRTFVLIPGAGGSSWIWSRVTPFLVEAGHQAIAVDLPGDDETAGLSRYTELVVDAIGSRPEVVLVAGSLGGFTTPLVCERVPVRELVLVNAMIPDPGETPREWWTHTCALEAQDEAARAGGYGPFDMATYFLHDVDPEVSAEGERY
jgi:pimeloyl-ACP methyl ester carboxylesterase